MTMVGEPDMLFVLFLFCFVFRQWERRIFLFPDCEIELNPCPLQWKTESLTTEPLGSSQTLALLMLLASPYNSSVTEALVFQPFHDTEGEVQEVPAQTPRE